MNVRTSYLTSRPGGRQGFTLIELLIVITVIGIMAAMAAVAMVSTQERVRTDRTKETIVKLNALVMAKWESYRTRRIPAPPVTAFNLSPTPPTLPPNITRELALARLDYLRELMCLEMPDRFSDILDDPVLPDPAQMPSGTAMQWSDLLSTAPKLSRPSLSWAYLNFCASRGVTGYAQVINNVYRNQNAECLYLMVTMGLEGGTNREVFGEDEVGDTDNDGFPEFVDGWGRPIKFLRWAPAFIPRTGAISFLQSDDLDGSGTVRDPDPFDPLKLDMGDAATNARIPPTATGYAHYALYPLIYSAGPDGGYGIFDGVLVNPATLAAPAEYYRYSLTNPPNDPYVKFSFTTSTGEAIPSNTNMGLPIRKHIEMVQSIEFGPATQAVGAARKAYFSSLFGDDPGGDSFDNIHNHLEPMTR